ncbi:Wzz/FepE/Etk N-terminal domain-containing protein [Rhodobacteraceae bacterium]|nr:Wzz/FepE/Etk N-terminal domain-containing protein [Paracoccaceae bacterium]
MSETPAHRDDEIDLFELFIKLWEGKWTIILAMIGATILGVFYLLILPNSYSGTTFVRAAQPSAFTRYTFLSEALETDNFTYKIDDKFVFDAFISEFNDLEEVIQTLRSDGSVIQELSEIEESEREGFIISRAKQFKIIPPQKGETETELRFTWGDVDAGKKIFETSLQLILTNVKATLAKDIIQYAQGAQSRLTIKIENATLKKDVIKEGIRLADRKRLLFLAEQATIARELGVAAAASKELMATTDVQNTQGLISTQENELSLSVTSSLPFYMRGYKAIEVEMSLIQARSPEDRLALSNEYAQVQQEIYALENDASVSRLLAARQMIDTDDPTRWVLFNLNLAKITSNKKANLILALSLVLGGMIGAIFVLIRSAVRKRKPSYDT